MSLTRSEHRGATDFSKLRFESMNRMRFVNRVPASSRTVDDSFTSSKVLKQHAWKPPGRYDRPWGQNQIFLIYNLNENIDECFLHSIRFSAPLNFRDISVNIIQENVRTSTSLWPHRPDKNLMYFDSMKIWKTSETLTVLTSTQCAHTLTSWSVECIKLETTSKQFLFKFEPVWASDFIDEMKWRILFAMWPMNSSSMSMTRLDVMICSSDSKERNLSVSRETIRFLAICVTGHVTSYRDLPYRMCCPVVAWRSRTFYSEYSFVPIRVASSANRQLTTIGYFRSRCKLPTQTQCQWNGNWT